MAIEQTTTTTTTDEQLTKKREQLTQTQITQTNSYSEYLKVMKAKTKEELINNLRHRSRHIRL